MRVVRNGVARDGETLDDRRYAVVELLQFIRDFSNLDTTLIVQRVLDDQTFLEAAEAVLASTVGPWKSVDALRDFCVQNLTGEKPLPTLGEAVRPRERATLFSVPLPLLKAAFEGPSDFDVRDLRSLNVSHPLSMDGIVGSETQWTQLVPSNEMWLVTTVWARAIPKLPRNTKAWIVSLGANRVLYDNPLWTFVADAMPCFWILGPNDGLDMRFTRQQPDSPSEVILALEGWRYAMR